jgi:hypothetical protein
MAVQAHKCNQAGCNGFIVFDNADFDYSEVVNTGKPLATSTCNSCRKEFFVGISHELFELDKDKQYVDTLPQVCITEYEKSKRTDINRNIEKVIQALNDYQSAVGKMDQDELDDFYNKCVQHNITNGLLYKFRDALKDVVMKTGI